MDRFRFWCGTAALFLLRSGKSTTILSLMVVLSVATLLFLGSLTVGVNDAMVRNSVSLGSGHISAFNLSPSLPPAALKIRGVSAVLKRTRSFGLLRHGDRLEGVTLVGVDPVEEQRTTALWKKVIRGRYPHRAERALLLSRFLAERLDVEVGDDLEFRLRPDASATTLRVSGIYRTGVEQLDRDLAFCPSEIAPRASEAWSAAVFLKQGASPDDVVFRYRRAYPSPARFVTWAEAMPDLRQLIDLNDVSMGLVTGIVFGIVSLGVSCAFVIFILKHVREYGIVKAMGVTAREMASLITAEVVMLNLAASCLGVLVGAVAVFLFQRTGIDLTMLTSENRYFAVSGVVFPRLTAHSLWVPPGAALLSSLVASVWPVALVVRSRAADLLRSF